MSEKNVTVSVKEAIKSLNEVSKQLETALVSIFGEKAEGVTATPQIKDDYIVVSVAVDISGENVVVKPDALRALADAVEIEGLLSKMTIGDGKLTIAVRTP